MVVVWVGDEPYQEVEISSEYNLRKIKYQNSKSPKNYNLNNYLFLPLFLLSD